MRKIKHIVALLFVSLVTSATSPSLADELDQLAPLLDEHTFAVLHVDLNGIDLPSLQKQYFDALARTNSDRLEVSAAVDQTQQAIGQLRADGVRHIYVVLTAARLPQLSLKNLEESLGTIVPFLAIPGAKAETLEHWRKKFWNANKRESQPDHKPPLKSGQIRGVGVVAFADLFDALAAQEPKPRPELAAALAAAENRPVRLAVVPPPLFTRAVEEILLDPLPDTKQPLGKVIARGLKWSSVGFEPNLDRLNAQLVIQSADVEAANDLARTIQAAANLAASKMAEGDKVQGILVTMLLPSLLPVAKEDRLVLSLNQERAAGMRQLLTGAMQLASANADRHSSMNNLKHLSLAIHNYYDKRKQLPDRAIRDKDGKPLLSWRVAILPWLGENKLYEEFHRDEPWDSEHNRKLIDRMPVVFKNPDTAQKHPGRTRYLAPVGEKLAFPPAGGLKFKEFTDGTSKTIMIVEAGADRAVIWTKPDDLEIDLADPTKGLTDGKANFNTAFVDGSARVIKGAVEPETLRRLLQRNDGQVVDPATF
jgi:hypothetical protein